MISVILCVLNGATTIGEQLDALNNQTYTNEWELLIIDNGSVDETVEIIQTYCQQMANLTLISYTDKKGKGYCCNFGAKHAKGDYLVFIDADDIVSPGWLKGIVYGLERSDLVTGPLNIEEINSLPFKWRMVSTANTIDERTLNFLPRLPGCNFAVRRSVFLDFGGFSDSFRYQQDAELSWRMQLKGYKLMFVPEAMIHYRYRDSFRSSWKQLANYADAHVNLYKHFKDDGMPRAPFRKALKRYKWLLLRAPKFIAVLLSKKTYPLQARYVHQAALSWGRLRGSVKYRTFYL